MNSATKDGVGRVPQEVLPRHPQEMTRRSPAKLRCVHRWIEMQAERTPHGDRSDLRGERPSLIPSSIPAPTVWLTAFALRA